MNPWPKWSLYHWTRADNSCTCISKGWKPSSMATSVLPGKGIKCASTGKPLELWCLDRGSFFHFLSATNLAFLLVVCNPSAYVSRLHRLVRKWCRRPFQWCASWPSEKVDHMSLEMLLQGCGKPIAKYLIAGASTCLAHGSCWWVRYIQNTFHQFNHPWTTGVNNTCLWQWSVGRCDMMFTCLYSCLLVCKFHPGQAAPNPPMLSPCVR